jgi:L-ascorbate metabolism protein UlaG (beta-lactamase superfamily)
MPPNLLASLRLTYIGGPTVLIEVGGLRLLTDPTFDPAGTEFRTGAYVLAKTGGPAIGAGSIGHLDAVLLSHDHHFDNLDASGRRLLESADRVLTTEAAAERLGGRVLGVPVWQSVEIPVPGSRAGPLLVTATPARHGPAHMDRGPVIGFGLSFADEPRRAVYVSGDTVWYEGVAEVGRWLDVELAILFMGAAKVEAVGPWHLTFTAEEGVEAARALARATIVPLHYEGWKHFSESRAEIAQAFDKAGLTSRLVWLAPGRPTTVLSATSGSGDHG